MNEHIVVAGGGSWGTALAHVLACSGHEVHIWLRDAEIARHIREQHENPKYLSGKKIALFGYGSYDLFAGGIGSGEVNAAKIVNIDEGLLDSGFSLQEDLTALYEGASGEIGISRRYAGLRAKDSDIAIVTLRRTAGEYVDRRAIPGDFYLTDLERDMLRNVGWNYEGIAWNSAGDDKSPLYRLYNPNAVSGAHHYTMSTEERDNLIALGWQYEGIGWYGL